jgi:hypothetical protein
MTATYRTLNTIRATLSAEGKVRFYLNGKQIPDCVSISSTSAIASCPWKPSNRGAVNLTARVVGGSSTAQINVGVTSRTNRR